MTAIMKSIDVNKEALMSVSKERKEGEKSTIVKSAQAAATFKAKKKMTPYRRGRISPVAEIGKCSYIPVSSSSTIVREPAIGRVDIVRKMLHVGKVGRRPQADGIQMHLSLQSGIEVTAVDDVKKRAGWSDKEMALYLGTSPSTLQRRRQQKANISFVEGDRLYRIAKIIAKAEEVFRDSDSATQWLKSEQIGLGGAIPFELVKSEAGADEVERLLIRIEHGVFS